MNGQVKFRRVCPRETARLPVLPWMADSILVELERAPVYSPGDILQGRVRVGGHQFNSVDISLEGSLVLDGSKSVFLAISQRLILAPNAHGFTDFALQIPIVANRLWQDVPLPSTLRLPGARGSIRYTLQVHTWSTGLLMCERPRGHGPTGFYRVENEVLVGEDAFTVAMVLPSTGFILGSYIQSRGVVDGIYIGLTAKSQMLKPMYNEIHAATLNIVTKVTQAGDTVEYIYNILAAESLHYHILERHESASSVLQAAQQIPVDIPPTTDIPGLKIEHFIDCGLRIRSLIDGVSKQVWLRSNARLAFTEQTLYIQTA